MVVVRRKTKGANNGSFQPRVLFIVENTIHRRCSTLGDGVTFQPYIYPSVISSSLTTVNDY